jgi:hypothetical protein
VLSLSCVVVVLLMKPHIKDEVVVVIEAWCLGWLDEVSINWTWTGWRRDLCFSLCSILDALQRPSALASLLFVSTVTTRDGKDCRCASPAWHLVASSAYRSLPLCGMKWSIHQVMHA